MSVESVIEKFDVDSFLSRSRALDLTGIDWELARTQPLSVAERRILPYFIDVESYTIGYLRALLNTSAIRDPEISDFLACWVYEESFHGRALERFLAESGHPLAPSRVRSIQKPRSLRQALKDGAAAGLSKIFAEDFVAVHMTWGAIQELSTLNGYRRMAEKTENGALAEIVRRIMRDESRHFSFYYHKARERLETSAAARGLTAALVARFWKPVGAGIMPDGELAFLMNHMFDGEEGRRQARHVDETIARLPGMEWFAGLERWLDRSLMRA